jgi:hypothetical protein
MSRLATLSSLEEHYSEAVYGLIALYLKRGYPNDLVRSWARKYYQERWNNRLRVESRDRPDVLVLKTHFNPAWNYFNAHELENTILGYMKEWLVKADFGTLGGIEYPRTPADWPSTTIERHGFQLKTLDSKGEVIYIPDVRHINILQRKLIVSRKRTTNLMDLASAWKRIVIEQLDERVSRPEEVLPSGSNEIHIPPTDHSGYRRLRSGKLIALGSDEAPQRRSPSPAPFDDVDDTDRLDTLFRVALR